MSVLYTCLFLSPCWPLSVPIFDAVTRSYLVNLVLVGLQKPHPYKQNRFHFNVQPWYGETWFACGHFRINLFWTVDTNLTREWQCVCFVESHAFFSRVMQNVFRFAHLHIGQCFAAQIPIMTYPKLWYMRKIPTWFHLFYWTCHSYSTFSKRQVIILVQCCLSPIVIMNRAVRVVSSRYTARYICDELWGCFTKVSRALRDILSKFEHCRVCTSLDNFKLKLCTCAQSDALGTRTKFQLAILTINVISVIVFCRKIRLESSRSVSEQTPWFYGE